MTSLAQVEIASKLHQKSVDLQSQIKLLVLSGWGPVQVFSRPMVASGRLVATFASPVDDSIWFGGLEWRIPPHTDTSLFINFTFVPNGDLPTIVSFDCDAPIPLLYSPVGNDKVSQQYALPPVPGIYRFHTLFSDGQRHDPQIVVTPE